MPKVNWKSLFLVGGVATIGGVLFSFGVLATVKLPFLGVRGLLSFSVLVLLALVSSWFTVPVTNVDGVSQTNKSLADGVIFLAVMMFTLSPANNLGPAIILAAIVGFIASFYLTARWSTLFATSASIISTFVA